MNLSKYCSDQRRDNNPNTPDSGQSGSHIRCPRMRRRKGWLYIIIAAVLAIAMAALILPFVGKKAPHSAIIRVPKGATEDMVVDSVDKYLGHDFAQNFRRAMPIAGGGAVLRHGAWEIEQGMTAITAARRIYKGGQVGLRLTFLNERTPEQIAAKVASRLDIPAEDMLRAMRDPKLLNELRTDSAHVVCFFLADSYEFYWTATPEEVLRKLKANYDRFWTQERVGKAEKLRLLPRDVVTLASIVDEETNVAQEKGIVGRLYINRLDKKMKLQADPTVRYALGDFTIKRVAGDMLKNPSPYNTYTHEGLPPGPIRVTSGATIDAILTSRPHSYLYMCASEDLSGVHNFATDYDTHMENARRYQEALDKRGIK